MVSFCINIILDPKKRQLWLKVWFSKVEKAESENYEFFEVTEEDEVDINGVLDNCYNSGNDSQTKNSKACQEHNSDGLSPNASLQL